MKHYCKAIVSTKFTNKIPLKNQKGQTLVEFMLILATILFMSLGLLYVTNRGIADRWQKYVEKIVNPPGTPASDKVTVQIR